jgi:hypothetical protein
MRVRTSQTGDRCDSAKLQYAAPGVLVHRAYFIFREPPKGMTSDAICCARGGALANAVQNYLAIFRQALGFGDGCMIFLKFG